MKKMDKRLEQQIDFLLEIDKEKNILRQTHLSGHGRNENDAEHAWHLAVMAMLLSEYSNEPVDKLRVMSMVLIHDLVEIDAGDTYAYDEKGCSTQSERERKAADRIFGMLPDDQGARMRALWEEFEAYESPEAKFAHTLDNFQPLLLNDSNDGGDWRSHGVRKSQILRRNAKTAEGSRDIWEWMEHLIRKNIDAGNIKDE